MAFIDLVQPVKEVAAAAAGAGQQVMTLAPAERKADIALIGMGDRVRSPCILSLERFAKEEKGLTQLQVEREIRRVRPFAVLDAEASPKRDFIHHRRSGLNEILMRALAEGGVAYIVPMVLLRKDLGGAWGRVEQNVRLAQRIGVRVVFATIAERPGDLCGEEEAKAVLRMLGVRQENVKRGLLSAEDRDALLRP